MHSLHCMHKICKIICHNYDNICKTKFTKYAQFPLLGGILLCIGEIGSKSQVKLAHNVCKHNAYTVQTKCIIYAE
jgi:hypothetical protein